MKSLSSVFITADTTGSLARIPGDYNIASYNTPRSPNLMSSNVFFLTGENYSIEYDSTAEIYVIFRNSFGTPTSDTVLLVRGMTVNIPANQIEVVGIRRSGTMRITAGTQAGKLELTNSPSGLADIFRQYWPAGSNGSTGPAGWTTTPDYLGLPSSFIAYNPARTVDVAGVFGGSARRLVSGAVTAGNYYALQYGYADVQDGEVIRFWPYYDRVIDTAAVSGTYAVDVQAYWRPAIFWSLTPAGVTANTPTSDLQLINGSTYTFKRTPAQMSLIYT